MENAIPLITTVIPSYKRPNLLKRAIKSVLNQTYKDLQVCIYDNASCDETRDVVKSFAICDSRVKYFCHESNIGSLKNFEYGLSKVNTPYFSFLSDDDFLFPDFYELAVKRLMQYPEAAFFAGNCITIGPNNNIVNTGFTGSEDRLFSMNESVNIYFAKTFSPWTSIVFNRQKVQPFKLETSFKISDIDYLCNIMYSHPAYISSKLCAVFCSMPSSCSANFQVDDILPLVDLILPKLDRYNTVDMEIHKEVSSRIISYVKQFLYVRSFEHIKSNNTEGLEKIKDLLRERFDALDLIKKIDLYLKIRKCYFLWYPLLFIRRYIIKGYKFLFSKIHFYKERKCVLKLLKSLSLNND